MSLSVDSSLLKKLAGGLSKLHSVYDDAVAWLTNYGGPYRIRTITTTTTTTGEWKWHSACKHML